MRERAQMWVSVSNREESMARVLSRAKLNEGTVLHAQRAAWSALVAVHAHNGWAYTSDRCRDLCEMLEAHDLTPPQDVIHAADALDEEAQKLDPESLGCPASDVFTDEVGARCLECVTRIRSYVNTLLTK